MRSPTKSDHARDVVVRLVAEVRIHLALITGGREHRTVLLFGIGEYELGRERVVKGAS